MAKNELKTLIRVHKFELDEKQRQLGKLLRFENALENRKILLAKKFKEEEDAAKNDVTAAITFGAYVDWHIEENKRVDRALADTRLEISYMRDEIREAYQELKTLEITQENREKRAAAELERKNNQVLDEIGLTLFRRKQDVEEEEKDNIDKNSAS